LEVDTNTDGEFYLTIHSGSRNFGARIAEYWQNRYSGHYVENGKQQEGKHSIPMTDYMEDLHYAELYVHMSHIAMIQNVCKYLKLKFRENNFLLTPHNYIEGKDGSYILHKGSISAKKDEKCIIPLNMADGVLLCKGKGYEPSLNSAPHGAGRIMSRSDAKNLLSTSKFKDDMKGVYSGCVNKSFIDEAPEAYRNSDSIIYAIKDMVDIEQHLKPIYNYKES
jgi:RNA-splicing ligase RtcB